MESKYIIDLEGILLVMKIERTKNASRNVAFGVVFKAYNTIIPFLMRTVIIYYMGVQYLGLSSLFASVLQVLNLAEMGVGSAMVYSMYKPIVDDDQVQICALMKLYKKYYRIIGGIIAIGGGLLTPAIPYLIKSDLPPDVNVYCLYLLNLAATVLSYWLFAYKNALFQAHQRIDITSKIMLVTTTIQYVLQIVVIIYLKNYYIYIIVSLFMQVVNNILTAIIANRMFPKYKAKGELDKFSVQEINQHVRDLFTSKLGGVILNSADTIVISTFLGLTTLAVYQNYYFIMSSIISVITIVFNSCTAGIGNSIIVETKQKNFKDLQKMLFLICWLGGWCTCCLLCLYQPFMHIWVGKELMLPFSYVICFCIYYFIYEVNQLLNIYKDAAGIWHKDRFRPLITAGANLLMNLLMVRFWGLYGVIISTLIATVAIGMPWLLNNLFSTLFDNSDMVFFIKKIIKYSIGVVCTCVVTYAASCLIDISYTISFIYKIAICILVPNAMFFLFYRNTWEYQEVLIMVKKIIKRP